MTRLDRPWPPLIIADHAPRFIRWRDFLLTLVMWLVFAVMLATEFELFFGRHLEKLGLGDFDTDANWAIFFERLTPFLLTMLVLVWMLTLAAVFTLQRRRRSLTLPTPAPLGLPEECRRAGMDGAALTSARALPIVIVHFDDQRRVHVAAGIPG